MKQPPLIRSNIHRRIALMGALIAPLIAAGPPANIPAPSQPAPGSTQPAPSGLRQVKLIAGMKRADAERAIAEATGTQSTYSPYAINASPEVSYRQGATLLLVQYKLGAPAPIITRPDGLTQGLPPVDSEVVSWRFLTEEPPASPPGSRPAPTLRAGL